MSGENWTGGEWVTVPCQSGGVRILRPESPQDALQIVPAADGHVMGAARELYAALKYASCPDCDGSKVRQTPNGIEPCGWCAQREQALAKARGEQEGT